MSKSKSKQEEALAFLDDLDSFTPQDTPAPDAAQPANPAQSGAGGEAEVLAFIDEITQKSAEPTPRSSALLVERPASRSGTPTVRKSTERVRLGVGAGGGTSLLRTASSSSLRKDAAATTTAAPETSASTGGWGLGWGNVWSGASSVIQQARSVVDEQVKYLPKNEQARKWGEGMIEYAKSAQLDKLGQDFKRVGLSTLTDILNVVAPPISEHEVIQVWLSHDMTGYEGIESLVYRALARIMEQVEGGDLIVNRGNESRPKESADTPRDLGAVEGFEAASKLAQANLDELMKINTKATPTSSTSDSSVQTPTTYSHLYLRIQPFLTSFAFPVSAASSEDPATAPTQQLQFLIHLCDPSHKLTQSTVTQCVPGDWLAEGMWEKYDWVEDLVAEALRVGVEVIGQEYVVKRMGWGSETQGNESAETKTAEVAADNVVGEPGELVEKPKLGEET
ncbi:maintenance of telomere capping protein 1 [Mycena sanguinolenta]|nr:maintenance of telomere capping protein 1 [Mycena sanguinolenta]